jgi:hypothetical protein
MGLFMNDVYVHTLRYRYSGRDNRRRSRTMFRVSYGPFRDEEAAREWIRQRGLIQATKLVYAPAAENIRIAHGHTAEVKDGSRAGLLRGRLRQDPLP